MDTENIRSKIWQEFEEKDNPFAAERCYCAGYDVYGEMLGKASWIEYLYLLIKGERPTESNKKLLEGLAISLANPGPRDYSVRGAMSAAVGGSTSASCLISAISIGAGGLGGAREVYSAVRSWQYCSDNLDLWRCYLTEERGDLLENEEVWPRQEHPPGFDPNGNSCSLPVKQTLDYLCELSTGKALHWLRQNRHDLEKITEMPLAMSGVAAACFIDLGFDGYQAEIIFLLLRLPGAAAHSLEQRIWGWRHYPFFSDAMNLQDDPIYKDSKRRVVANNIQEPEHHE